jgi:hypothetical protein
MGVQIITTLKNINLFEFFYNSRGEKSEINLTRLILRHQQSWLLLEAK